MTTNDEENFPAATAGPSVDRVAVKLPPFWPEDPEVWFVQVEAQFRIAAITDDNTKFYYIVSQLDQKYMREIKDVIKSPPASGKFDKIKQELIKRLSISRQHQIAQLLSHEELGDRKPSQFLRHLKTLAADGVNDEFLRSLWTSRLPPHVQAIVVSQSSGKIDDVAELADKVLEVAPVHQVASAATPSPSLAVDAFNDLTRRIDELTREIAQLKSRDSRSRSTSHGRYRSRSRSRSRNEDLCWYHDTFGEKARKCTQPCSYSAPAKGNASGSL